MSGSIGFVYVVLLTLIPFLELRYSIPVGILHGTVNLPFGIALSGFGLNPALVVMVAIITNILLGILLYAVLNYIVHYLRMISWFERIYSKVLGRYQRKIEPKVLKYGTLGIAFFIAFPLPGSGVYSGALGAYALGMSFREFIIADVIGVIIAAGLVTTFTLFGSFFI